MPIEKSPKPTPGASKNLPGRGAALSMEHRRFLSDNPVAYKNAIDAAQSYVSKLEPGDIGWLHSKPFDPTPGNPQFFRLMFDLMNILQAMRIPVRGRILEVGSGPGWITEILLMLGFSVDALEPSSDLIKIAQERCASLYPHYRHVGEPTVRFHQSTLESIEFEDESFDAILFFDVLHHVVDENIAFQKSFRFLRHGGCLGVVEGAWHPDFKELEAALIAEMAKFGTLENPFSVQYLDHLLESNGFIDIERYVGINGFFTKRQISEKLLHALATSLAGTNNLMARKPDNDVSRFPSCADINFRTEARIALVEGGIDAKSRTATVLIDCTNNGQTLLDSRCERAGYVTISLRRGTPGASEFIECKERHPLTKTLIPGQTIRMSLRFTLPPQAPLDQWELDGVAEGLFWFSSRDVATCGVKVVSDGKRD